MRKIGGFIWLFSACSLAVWGQNAVPARIVITTGHYYTQEAPSLTINDLVVTQDDKPVTITNVTPLHGDLELFVVVDNSSSSEAGQKPEEFDKFITTLPPTTSVGVAYIQDGKLQIAENPTTDRERVLKLLNPPGGSKPASPYNALAELINGWKQGSSRRAVLMISTGFDPAAAGAELLRSESAEAAIQAAERAEVKVYIIYHPSADYATTDFSKIYAGQVQLSHVAAETGGEAYFLGFGPLPSIVPFLADINQHLANQYLVEFLASPGNSPGELRDVEIKSKTPDLHLLAPYKIVVTANRARDPKTRVAPKKLQ
jgi:hypothetical protein